MPCSPLRVAKWPVWKNSRLYVLLLSPEVRGSPVCAIEDAAAVKVAENID
jgi:hypothetical protein